MDKKVLTFAILSTLAASLIIYYCYSFGMRFKTFDITYPPSIEDKYVFAVTIYPKQTSQLYNVQIPIFLTSDNFDFSRLLYDDGRDIRFYDSNGDPIRYYVERINKTQQIGQVWVLVPELPPAPNTVTLYLGCGTQTEDNSDLTIFYRSVTYENGVIAWVSTNEDKVEVSADNNIRIQGYYSNKIHWRVNDEAAYRAYMYFDFGMTTKCDINFWVRRQSPYTGSDTFFRIWINKGGYQYGYLNIRNDGSVGYMSLTETFSSPGLIPEGKWRLIQLLMDFNNAKVTLIVRDTDGTILHEVSTATQVGSGFSTVDGFWVESTSSLYYHTIRGTLWIDFTVTTQYVFPPPSTIVEVPPPTYRIQLLSDLTYPSSTTNQVAKVQLTYGSEPVEGETITMTILPKEGTSWLGSSSSAITDANGIAVITFDSPPYYDINTHEVLSPYTVVFEVSTLANVSLTKQLIVKPKIDIEFTKLDITQTYNTQGDEDFYMEFNIIDAELGTDLIASQTSIDVNLKTSDGYLIYPTVKPSPTSGQVIVTAKVYNTVKDTTTRQVNITISVSKENYYPVTKYQTIQMVAPKLMIIIQLAPVINVGTAGFEITFKDEKGDFYNLPGDAVSNINNYVKVSIIDLDRNIEYTNIAHDFDIIVLDQSSLWVDFMFDTAGNYKILVQTMNIDYEISQYKLVTVQESFLPPYITSPYTWLGVIILIAIIYLIFHKGERKEVETW